MGDQAMVYQFLQETEMFSSPKHFDYVWGPVSIIKNEKSGLPPGGVKRSDGEMTISKV